MVAVPERRTRNGLEVIVIPTIATAVNFGVFVAKQPMLPGCAGSGCRLPRAHSGIRGIATTTRSAEPTLQKPLANTRNI